MEITRYSNNKGSSAATWLILFSSMVMSGVVWAGNECFPVQGTFKSQTLPPNECTSPVAFCTRGVLTGGLWGDYEFVAQQFISAMNLRCSRRISILDSVPYIHGAGNSN